MKKFVSCLVVIVFTVLFAVFAFAANFPEWDGVYLKDREGNYEELKEISTVRINSSPGGVLYFNTKDFTIIDPNKFKGIMIKGKELVKDVTFKYVERTTEISLTALFNRSKAKFQDTFSLEPASGFFELRNRQEGEDARYYEPPKEAMQFFGTADKGHFVLLKVGNGKHFIFGIDAETKEDPSKK